MTAIAQGMTNAQYHGLPAFSASLAKLIVQRSPLHAWTASRSLNPDYEEEHKDEYDLGTVCHALVLEGSEANLAVIEAPDWRTKAAKEAREAARAEGKTPILEKKMPQVRAIVKAARSCIDSSELADIFNGAQIEQPIQWKEGSIACRCKPDLFNPMFFDGTVLDLKTTQNAEPNAFIRQITGLAYDVQADFYLRGTKAKRFIFLAVETEAPYATSLVALGPQMLEIAARKVDFALAIWAQCLKNDRWNGYSNQIHYAEPNPWDAARWLETEEA